LQEREGGEKVAKARLVTWNQFFSASAYEREEPISWAVLEDLSSLIDLLCMYDRLRVIGDPDQPPFLTHKTDFFGAMRGSRAIDVHAPSGPKLEALHSLTRRHLRLCLPALPISDVDSWLSKAFALNAVPEVRERVATMNAEVRLGAAPELSTGDFSQLANVLARPDDQLALRPFVVRTFMYLAYAEIEEMPFAADSSRRVLASNAIACESDLASQLLERIKNQWKKYPSVGAVRLRSRTSPFSAVVFERSKGDRRAIPTEILQLRDELKSIRERVAEFERRILSATERDDEVRAESKWNAVLGEIERSFGPSPRLVSLSSGIALADAVGKVLDHPQKPTSYLSALEKLPLDIVVRLFRRQPMAQAHKLRSELPSSSRLVSAIRSVFPEMPFVA
jgi:hypothetical protein